MYIFSSNRVGIKTKEKKKMGKEENTNGTTESGMKVKHVLRRNASALSNYTVLV